MASYRYLIVGGGMAGHAAARGIRNHDLSAEIGLIGAEPNRPYKRPPLSKGLWKGEPRSGVWLDEVPGLELLVGRTVTSIDRARKVVTDDLGRSHAYGTLLIATGGSPRRLSLDAGRVNYFRSLDDFDRLRALPAGSRVAVVGGGFIGSEISAALVLNGYEVTLLFPDARISDRMFPADLGDFLNGYFREKGIDVRPRTKVAAVEAHGAETRVVWAGGDVVVDSVVAGLGIVPNVDLALAAGLEVQDGIIVDYGLRSSDRNIFAAGDVARFQSSLLGGLVRVEHEDNAVTMGFAAGAAMTGETIDYQHQPFFYSDLFELGYEAIGETDRRLEVIADWKSEHREGVLYYLKNGRVRGVVTWGIFGQMDKARALIAEAGPHDRHSLVGRLSG